MVFPKGALQSFLETGWDLVTNLWIRENINYCYLSSDSSYVIESAGMDQKGKVVFL